MSSGVIAIPLRGGGEEADKVKSMTRFAIEVWNCTQNWADLATKTVSVLEMLVNNRLQMMYARYNFDDIPTSSEVGGGHAKATLSADEKMRLTREIVRDAEKLSGYMDDFQRIIGKFRTAYGRLRALRQLNPHAGRIVGNILDTLEAVLPDVIKMYECELAEKRKRLLEISSVEHAEMFTAALVYFKFEPCIDLNLLSRLFALVSTEEFIEIPTAPGQLPSGAEVLDFLKNEKAPLRVWIDLAVAYYRNNMLNDFVSILECSGNEASLEDDQVEEDQMRALDTLAAYYVRMGHLEKANKEQRKEYFKKATLLYTTADKIKMYDNVHLCGRAYFCLVENKSNKLESAEHQFNFVMKQSPNNVPALLGKACISFFHKDYKTALYLYKKILRQNPNCPADIRVGIGYCLARIGKMEKARIALERALELNPHHVSALSAAAIVYANTHSKEYMHLSLQALGLAYKLEPEHPVVLTHLANHFFYKGEVDKVEGLAMHAMQMAENDQIKAEASFQLARCYHVNKIYDKAFKYYYQATTLNHPSFILPYFGLGQLYIYRGDYAQAIEAFEHILKTVPNNYDALKAVASLYAHADADDVEKKQKARETFTKLLEMNNDDIEVLIELAQLTESVDPAKSLSLYQRCCDVLTNNEQVEVPPEMLNNMGTLAMSLGDYEKAKEYYLSAQEKLQEQAVSDIEELRAEADSSLVTVTYNIARCNEHLCLFDDAEKIYRSIQAKENYIDCYLRLGCLARDRGQIYESSVWFKEAMSVNAADVNAWTLIGNLHMSKHEWGPAQKKFEHILKMNKHDAYAWTALGNIWLETLFNPGRNRGDDEKNITRALDSFARALRIQPKNMWAANGIGCVLAFKQNWQDARDIFTQVREATSEFFDVWMNIAHVYMETKQYVSAIQMYSNAMKKFNKENDPMMLQYLARAFYRSKKMLECREALEKAMGEAADNIQIKFNHALVLKKISMATLKEVKATTDMVNGAVHDLRTAERVLNFIARNKDDSLGGVRLLSRTMAGDEARECSDLLRQAQTYLARAQRQDEEESRLRAKQEEERYALKQRMIAEAQEKEEEARKKAEEMKMMRTTFVQMTKDFLKMPEIVEEKKTRSGGGGRGRKRGEDGEEFVNDSSDMGDWRGEEGGEGGDLRERKKKDKSAKKRREKRDKGGSGSDDDRAEKKKRKADAAARKAEAKLSAKQSAKIKSRAYLSSSDSSGDEAPKRHVEPEPEDSPPPPRIGSSDEGSSSPADSDDSRPKKRKKKPAMSGSDEDLSDAGSDAPIVRIGDESDAGSGGRGGGGSGSDVGSGSGDDDKVTKKLKKRLASDSDEDSD